jgi:hypothetical protein
MDGSRSLCKMLIDQFVPDTGAASIRQISDAVTLARHGVGVCCACPGGSADNLSASRQRDYENA